MCDNVDSMNSMWASFDVTLVLLPLAVAFATARASAIMSLSVFVGFALCMVRMASLMRRCSSGGTMYVALHRKARRTLNAKPAASAPPSAASVGPWLGMEVS